MEFPVRCFSCGKVIGHLWNKFKIRVDDGENPAKVLDSLGIKRYCCRRMFLSHVELWEEVIPFRRL